MADSSTDLGKGKRITGGDRSTLADELRKRYDGGESIRSLAESTKRSYGFVHRLLSESGATLRSRSHAEKAEYMRVVFSHVWPKLVWPTPANGGIKLTIDSVFPLKDAQKAFKRMQERLHMGKILLEVAP